MLTLDELNKIISGTTKGIKDIRENKDSDILIWRDWYHGYVRTFHHYYEWNSIKKVERDRLSMQGARLVCKEWSTLIVNEKVKIGLDDENQSKTLNDILSSLKLRTKLSVAVEQGFALSNAAIAIDFENVTTLDKKNDEGMYTIESGTPILTTFNAWSTYPIEIEDGEYKQVAFVKDLGHANKRFILHIKNDDGNYDICIVDDFQSEKNRKVVYLNLNSPVKLFTIVHPNEVNNLTLDNNGYISVFANAIPELKALDIAYDNLNNEILLGKKRLWISSDLTVKNKETGQDEPLFDPNDTVYNILPKSRAPAGQEKEMAIKDTTTELRVDQIIQAITYHLNALGKNVGLGSKFFKTDSTGMVTATQVISENSDTYNNLKKHEIVIKENIIDICRAVMFISNEMLGDYDFDYSQNVNIEFDDSIIQDKDTEKASDLKDVGAGIMSKVEYRMKWYNESKETAEEKVSNFFGDDSLANRIARFKDAYTFGLMTPEDFVNNVYIEKNDNEKAAIVDYLKTSKTASDISDTFGMGTSSGADYDSLFSDDKNGE